MLVDVAQCWEILGRPARAPYLTHKTECFCNVHSPHMFITLEIKYTSINPPFGDKSEGFNLYSCWPKMFAVVYVYCEHSFARCPQCKKCLVNLPDGCKSNAKNNH